MSRLIAWHTLTASDSLDGHLILPRVLRPVTSGGDIDAPDAIAGDDQYVFLQVGSKYRASGAAFGWYADTLIERGAELRLEDLALKYESAMYQGEYMVDHNGEPYETDRGAIWSPKSIIAVLKVREKNTFTKESAKRRLRPGCELLWWGPLDIRTCQFT